MLHKELVFNKEFMHALHRLLLSKYYADIARYPFVLILAGLDDLILFSLFPSIEHTRNLLIKTINDKVASYVYF